MKFQKKIKSINEVKSIVKSFKNTGKKTVLSVGIFDILHPGIIAHLKKAKQQGDILIVGVIKNKDVKRGPERPIFSEVLRLENVAVIGFVDYVCLVDDKKTLECLKQIKPDIFAKGESFKERNKKTLKKLQGEEKSIKNIGCRIYVTENVSSSTSIINQFLDLYSETTKKYLLKMKNKYGSAFILEQLKSLKNMKVLVIGDGIIDEYHYCEAMGRSSKVPLVVSRFLNSEAFAGGVFAAANNIAGLCDKVTMVSALGDKNNLKKFALNHLSSNIKPKFFYRPDSETIIKKRFIEQYSGNKLFEICHMDKGDMPEVEERKILKYLNAEIGKYDMVLALDFGHGLFTDKTIRLLEKKAKFLAVNVQTNSANSGFNMMTKYKKIDFGCLTEVEARLSRHDEYGAIEDVIKKLSKQVKTSNMIMTRGKQGSMAYGRKAGFEYAPALSSRVVDRIGAGDAFFSFVAPCAAKKMPLDLISFVGNAAGAIAVQIVCNKEPVEANKLFEFIRSLLV